MANYLFNGVEIPELPDWDKDLYPYAFIFISDRDLDGESVVGHNLVVTDSIGYVTHPTDSNGEVISNDYLYTLGGSDLFEDESDPISYIVWGDMYPNDPVNRKWEQIGAGQKSNIFAGYVILWTNAAIYDANGSLVLDASDPVPVKAFDLQSFLNFLAAGLVCKGTLSRVQKEPVLVGGLTSLDGYTLQDSNGLYLIPKED